MSEKMLARRTERKTVVYVRQSSPHQVRHNNESRRLQYEMKQRVLALGWSEVEVIDDDLGRSASSTVERVGFQRMVTDVCLGKVGAVAAREVSRFARNNRDWHQLIEMCALVDTLLIDHETVYDPRCANDRLLLGLKGSMSEYELELLRQRSLEARWSKAKRGELVLRPPVGFIKTPDQRLEVDPDRRIQHSINLVFTKFFELGAAWQALIYFIEEGIELPALRYEEDRFVTFWRRANYQIVLRSLTNPAYAGAYCYGRTKHSERVIDGVLRKTSTHQPMHEWGVLIPEHHQGYTSWAEFEKIQNMLKRNVSNFGTGGLAAAKRGSALLGAYSDASVAAAGSWLPIPVAMAPYPRTHAVAGISTMLRVGASSLAELPSTKLCRVNCFA
jgi:DNA invertase Pin-like site-specific DNA recombinase